MSCSVPAPVCIRATRIVAGLSKLQSWLECPSLTGRSGLCWLRGRDAYIRTSASKSSIRRFVITEKAPTRDFSWLKAATTAFTFKTLLRHYANQALTPRSLNVSLGPRRKGHKGRVGWLA